MVLREKSGEYLVYSTVRSKPLTNLEIQQCVSHVLKSLKVQGSLSIHCIGDLRMRQLNRHYRGKDKTTDVLSFSLREGKSISPHAEELGDIFISVPQIERQASSLSISSREEFIRMLIHGILHILGHDHEKENDAKLMFSIQEKFLTQLV